MEKADLNDLWKYLAKNRALSANLIASLSAEWPGFLVWASDEENAISLVTVITGLDSLPLTPLPSSLQKNKLAELAILTAETPRFSAYAAFFTYLLCYSPTFNQNLWSLFTPLADCLAGMPERINLLAILTAAVNIAHLAQQRDIPANELAAAQQRIAEVVAEALSNPGLSLSYSLLPEVAYDLRLCTYELQGFSFSLQPFYSPVTLFLNKTGQLTFLPLSGCRFREDGYLADKKDGISDSLVSDAQENDTCWQTNICINENGLASIKHERLNKNDWHCLLTPGEQAIEFHVLPGADLDEANFRSAFLQALAYYRQHFPEISPKAIYAVSWLFEPLLAEWLPLQSHIRKFQSIFHRFPAEYDTDYVEQVILGNTPFSLQTTLQRRLIAYQEKGGFLREMGGLLLSLELI